jgi:dTDP-4-dehydrorhamnose reductase
VKVLLTGKNGQLGKELIRQLELEKIQICAMNSKELDISVHKEVSKAIKDFLPDVIINCAAYNKVDDAEVEIENAFQVNAIGAQNLAIEANNIGAKVVHISTDYVFSGDNNSPLREYHKAEPINTYGKSKSWGEELVIQSTNKFFILRTAWLYGDGNNFVKTMIKLAKEKDTLKVVNDQYGTPTSTEELAKVIIKLIKTENYGIYHATCEGFCTWFDFASKIFEIKGINKNIIPCSSDEFKRKAKRPKHVVLENFKLNLLGLNNFSNWEVALEEYLKNLDI